MFLVVEEEIQICRGGGGAGVSTRGNRHHPYRSNPSTRRDTDSYIPRPAVSSSSSIPKQVSLLANGRPTLRIKNIHPELNGEDLSNLFSSISPVDFVKFDDDNDTIYICFKMIVKEVIWKPLLNLMGKSYG